MDLLIDTGVRLAKARYAVFGIDYEGHGKSAGTRCYIKYFDDLVTDYATFFRIVVGISNWDVVHAIMYLNVTLICVH